MSKIRVDFSECKQGHALLAVAYEFDEETRRVTKIFCLDPSANTPKTTIWNSYIDVSDLRKPSIYVNDDPNHRPEMCRLSDYLILHDTDLDII